MNPHDLFRSTTAILYQKTHRTFVEVESSTLSWSVNDAGASHGAIVVERMRTFGGYLLDWEPHWQRLVDGAKFFSIELPLTHKDFLQQCHRLIERNQKIIEQVQDVSIVVLVSPGEPQTADTSEASDATCMMHLAPIDFGKLASWYRDGAPLVVCHPTTVPDSCWSHTIKTRSRIPYWLADRQARQRGPQAIGLLRTVRGTIADSSIANVLMVTERGSIVSPQRADILPGISLAKAERLLRQLGYGIEFRDIEESELLEAQEVLMTGTTGCVWPVGCIHSTRFNSRLVFEKLSAAWIESLGFDFISQCTAPKS